MNFIERVVHWLSAMLANAAQSSPDSPSTRIDPSRPKPTESKAAEGRTDDAAFTPEAIERYLEPYRQAIESTRRAVIYLELNSGEASRTESKVGGAPYLPPGGAMPRAANGNQLVLLAQFNFEEMPKVEGFPTSGLLQFFIEPEDGWGADLSPPYSEEQMCRPDGFRVIYHAKVETDETKLPPAPEVDAEVNFPFDPSEAMRIRFTVSTETVTINDDNFDSTLGVSIYELSRRLSAAHGLNENTLFHHLVRYLEPRGSAHKLGGYHALTQNDPRATGSKKQLLFQLVSECEGGEQMMWGDDGVGTFFIDPRDLAKLDFSKVLYTWDCH